MTRSEFLELLAAEAAAELVRVKILGPACIRNNKESVHFYIPKFVTRANIVRLSGYVGIAAPLAPGYETKREIALADAWLLNILNLPWLYPNIYYDRADPETGARRAGSALGEVMDMLPSALSELPPPADAVSGARWQEDRRACLLGNMHRYMRS